MRVCAAVVLARAARGGGGAGSLARPCCVRPSGRPLRCCCCSSRACWPSALCCTAVAERGCVQQKHHGCCWLVLLPVHLEQLLRGAPGPAQLARRARARRRGRCAGWLALQRHPAAQGHVACLVFGVGQLVLHMENGLLEIFLPVCGSSTPARHRAAEPSSAGRRAVLPLLCCWPSGARAAPGSSLVVA